MAFEFVKFTGQRPAKGSIRKNGHIGLNESALEAFRPRPEYITIYYDRETRILGLKAAAKDDQGAVPLYARPHNAFCGGRSVLAAFGIPQPGKSTAYYASWSDEYGMLLIDLSNPVPTRTGRVLT